MYEPHRKNSKHRISSADKKIDEAVKNAYAAYGPDLTAFFKAVQKEHLKTNERREAHSDQRRRSNS